MGRLRLLQGCNITPELKEVLLSRSGTSIRPQLERDCPQFRPLRRYSPYGAIQKLCSSSVVVTGNAGGGIDHRLLADCDEANTWPLEILY